MSGSTFKDKVVIITGASRGIGREIALQLADQGAWLALAARSRDALQGVQQECMLRAGKAIAIPTDICDQAQCQALVEQTIQEYGRLDMLVNNAGRSMYAFFEEVTDLDMFDQLMHLNYLGSVYCTYYALPYLKKSKGRIVAVSSLTGKTGIPSRSGYVASKHAMAGFFDTLRIELAPSQVSVTVIYPGFVASAIRGLAIGKDGQSLGRSTIQEDKAMPVETCARMTIDAAAKRKREVVMTFRGKIGLWLKLIAPGLVARIASQAINTGR
jgi:short-subunit dehydrogenase